MHSLAFGILMGQKLEALGETHLLSKSQRTVWLTLVLGHCQKRDCDMQLPAVPPVKGLLDPAKHAPCSNSSYTALWTIACSLPCERCSFHWGYFCHFGDKKWSNNIACMPFASVLVFCIHCSLSQKFHRMSSFSSDSHGQS